MKQRQATNAAAARLEGAAWKEGGGLTLGVKMAVVIVTTTGRCTSAHSGMETCIRARSRIISH
jgi:hypothetical protein